MCPMRVFVNDAILNRSETIHQSVFNDQCRASADLRPERIIERHHGSGRHGNVEVHVDEAGHQGFFAGINSLGIRSGFNLRSGAAS